MVLPSGPKKKQGGRSFVTLLASHERQGDPVVAPGVGLLQRTLLKTGECGPGTHRDLNACFHLLITRPQYLRGIQREHVHIPDA